MRSKTCVQPELARRRISSCLESILARSGWEGWNANVYFFFNRRSSLSIVHEPRFQSRVSLQDSSAPDGFVRPPGSGPADVRLLESRRRAKSGRRPSGCTRSAWS
jgi:hypothetical protein